MMKRYVTRNTTHKVITCFLTILLLFGLVMPVRNIAMAAETDIAEDTNLTYETGGDQDASIANSDVSDDLNPALGSFDESDDVTDEEDKANDNPDGLAEYFPSVIEAPIVLPSYYFQKGIANTASTGLQDTIAVNKTAIRTKNENGGKVGCRTFEVTLEITGTPQAAPVDVVLILDRSGSMGYSASNYGYNKIAQEPSSQTTYYVKINGSYQAVSHSSGVWRYRSNNNYRYVKWDFNGDDNAAGSDNSSNPTSKPFYIRGNTRLHHAKEAAINFAAKVLGPDGIPGSRVSVVSYSGPSSTSGNGAQSQASTDIGLTDNLTSIVNAINGLSAVGGTNTQAGFIQGKGVIEGAGNPNSNKVVIMFTDGLPTASNGHRYAVTTDANHVHVTSAIAAGKSIFESKKADVFTVGLLQNMTDAEQTLALNILNQTQNKGFYEAPTAEDLNLIFEEISQKLAYSATQAEVVDKIGDNFNLIEDSLPEGVTYDSSTREITWKPGTIVEKSELKYIVQAKPEFDSGLAKTNEYAKLTYTDILGISNKKKDFPKPEVNVPAKLAVTLTDATIIIGESIALGTGADSEGENYMSGITGGDGDGSYTYEWRVEGNSAIISTERNPNVTPQDDTTYKLTVTDSNGCKAIAKMKVTVLKTFDVTIIKEVTGNFGDRTSNFSFTVTINKGESKSFDLSHGETYKLENLLLTDVVRLTEDVNGHTVTVTASGIEQPIAQVNGVYIIKVSEMDDSKTITVTNYKNINIDTGISLDSLPYIIILAIVIAGITVIFLRKRRISNED